MKRPINKIVTLMFISIFITTLCSFAAENAERIILTTYYPAPYGVYKEMRVDQLAVGSIYRYEPLFNGTLIVSKRLGVGTSVPQDTLQVVGPSSRTFLIGETGGNFGESNSYIGFGARVDTNPNISYANSLKKVAYDQPGGGLISVTGHGNMNFRTFNATIDSGNLLDPDVSINPSESIRMTITDKGLVGIGTITPFTDPYERALLHVVDNQDAGGPSFGGVRIEKKDPFQGSGEKTVFLDLVNHHSSSDRIYRLQNVAESGGREGNFEIWDNWPADNPTNPKVRFAIDKGGNVGIGTTNPVASLTIDNNYGNSPCQGCEPINFVVGGTQAMAFNTYWDGPAAQWKYHENGGAATVAFLDGSLSLLVAPSGSAGNAVPYFRDGVFISSTGLVGVGTNNPKATLTVDNNQGCTSGCEPINFVVGGSQVLAFNTYWDSAVSKWRRHESGYAATVSFEDGPFRIRMAPNGAADSIINDGDFKNAININSDGRIGIGVAPPAQYFSDTALYIGGWKSGIYVTTAGTTTPSDAIIGRTTGTSVGVKGVGDYRGVVGIAGSVAGWNPGNAGVTGGSQYGGVIGWGGGTSFDFDAQGPATVNYAATSSIRWKKNIKPIDNALEKTLKLRGVYFDWDKDHGDRHDFGMIAEEVGQFFPEDVVYESDSKYASGMDYGKLTAVLVEAIKEQQKQIEELKKEIEQLKK